MVVKALARAESSLRGAVNSYGSPAFLPSTLSPPHPHAMPILLLRVPKTLFTSDLQPSILPCSVPKYRVPRWFYGKDSYSAIKTVVVLYYVVRLVRFIRKIQRLQVTGRPHYVQAAIHRTHARESTQSTGTGLGEVVVTVSWLLLIYCGCPSSVCHRLHPLLPLHTHTHILLHPATTHHFLSHHTHTHRASRRMYWTH